MRGFQQIHGDLEALGARVAGVSADTWAALGVFGSQNDIQFPLLSDWPALKTIAVFGVGREGNPTAQRVTFVFDADGTLRGVVDDAGDMEAHPKGALALAREIAGSS